MRMLAGAQTQFMERLRPLATTYARQVPVRRVAVVANAPMTPSDERADLIDSADVVFRINGFAADDPGAERSLGSRTDIVVFNRAVRPSPWFFHDYTRRLYLLIEPGRMSWEPEIYPSWWPRDLGFVTVPNRDVIVPFNAAMGLDAERDQRWGTTGTTTVWIARMLFPDADLTVTGLSMVDSPDQTSWEHAYGDPCPVGPEHLIDREGQLLRQWDAEGLITFVR